MSNKKNVHYNLDNLDKENAIINIIYGQRSNGKSYQVKHKKAVVKYLETGKRFILMRRYKEEISTEKMERYFADIDIENLTEGRYNCVSVYNKKIYLANYNVEKGKVTRGEHIGYTVALNLEQHYAGSSFLDVEDIIFEEFMSRTEYLGNSEPDKLINFRSTVDRNRNVVKLWLVGNTISRVCPYIDEWGLHSLVSKQKQGTIESVYLPTGTFDEAGQEITIKCSIEYCKDSGQSSFAIGKHKDMLNKGSWQSDPQPHLPKSYKEYRKIFRFMFQYREFKYVSEYLQDKESRETCWYVYPYEGVIDDHTVVISDQVKVSRYWQRDLYNTNFPNESLNELLKTFRESNVFFATDLCGTDFKQVIDFTIRK